MEGERDQEDLDPAEPDEAQSESPPDEDEMIEPDADKLDTEVEDADLFLGEDDEESEEEQP